ncbi:MAG: GerW family sporulation protein [Clostridia bacterium]|nr:GerW family sporulation protein [Clostridia bacterium]
MHPIENIMQSTMEQIKKMVDVNTVVGAPIIADGNTTVVPVSKVCLGFLAGGGEYCAKTPVKKSGEQADAENGRYPFAGTAVVGMNITPMAFVAAQKDSVNVMPVSYDCTVDRIVEFIPQVITGLAGVLKSTCGCGGKGSSAGERAHNGSEDYEE